VIFAFPLNFRPGMHLAKQLAAAARGQAVLGHLFQGPAAVADAADVAVADDLAVVQQRLVVSAEGEIDMSTQPGQSALAIFLSAIDQAQSRLQLQAASRSYRSDFTANYRAIFPDETGRFYRADVLVASVDSQTSFWVNGSKFQLSPEAVCAAAALKHAWSGLLVALTKWRSARAYCSQPLLVGVRDALGNLDHAWASFESRYIGELIFIENKAKKILVEAVRLESAMRELEEQYGSQGPPKHLSEQHAEYRHHRRQLASQISILNVVANSRRKGRGDLSPEILEAALAALPRCAGAEEDEREQDEALEPVRLVATGVADSFRNVREYLLGVSTRMERVDPHLCNNRGLVSVLATWEECWELGAHYVRKPGLLAAMTHLVGTVSAARRWLPGLAAMVEECDAELFMVLPRLVWLCFLAEPCVASDLVQTLLPHHFRQSKEDAEPLALPLGWAEIRADAELQRLAAEFQQTVQLLTDTQCDSAMKVLIARAVAGSGEAEGQWAQNLSGPAQMAVEDFMRGLESWSVELQRHCPQDWNQCSSILIRCLSGGGDKARVINRRPSFTRV